MLMGQPARICRRGTLTYRDLWQTPDDGNRWEIINGEVFVSPAPYLSHQRVLGNLGYALRQHVIEHGLGEVFWAPVAVVLEKSSAVQPDLIFVAKLRRSILEEKGVFGAPDLVAEVLSPSTAARDRGMKKDLYARTGVPQYWLLDPRKRTLLALRLESGAYTVEADLGVEDTFKPAIFPGLALRLREVFAD